MKNITKQEALKKIEELKKYIADKDKEKKGYVIRNRFNDSEIFVSTKDNVKDAVLEAIESEANLRGADLIGANLLRADLRGANLYEADLYEANLREADLREANLCEADLGGANLLRADLRGANLYEADLYEANLCEADLYEANLCEAELNNAKFYGKSGTSKLKKKQVETFLKALGFQIED